MKERSTRRDGFSLLGVGAVACVACCAGPILAVLGGVSLVGLASAVFIGAGGLVIAVAALAAYFVVRQRQHRNRDTVIEPVPVELGRSPE